MADEVVRATTTTNAPVEDVFDALADPTKHPAIDGTGWVHEAIDSKPLTSTGQVFRITMYHANHPDGYYEMANRVETFERPKAISWQPGQEDGDGNLRFGGWIWRYDLVSTGPSQTRVTLTYDWSAVPESRRAHLPPLPPFPPEHLDNSLAHLAQLVTRRPSSQARACADGTGFSIHR